MYDYKKIGAQRRNEIHLNERARNPTWVLRLLVSVLPSAMHSLLLEILLPVASETLQAGAASTLLFVGSQRPEGFIEKRIK